MLLFCVNNTDKAVNILFYLQLIKQSVVKAFTSKYVYIWLHLIIYLNLKRQFVMNLLSKSSNYFQKNKNNNKKLFRERF